MKNLKLYLSIFLCISLFEIILFFILLLLKSFYNFELMEFPKINETTLKNIRGFIIVNLTVSIFYFLLIKFMRLGFYNSSIER